MDLDVVRKSQDCPYVVRCLGCFITDADVWISMELMTMCLDKLLKRLKGPIPEPILGEMTVAVSISILEAASNRHNLRGKSPLELESRKGYFHIF